MIPRWLIDVLTNLIPAVVVAVITAIITVSLALKRFRQEKWWEKKEQAYARLLDTLHYLKRHNSRYLENYYDKGTTDDESRELELMWKEQSAKLEHIEDLASFHLSTQAVRILATHRKRLNDARSDAQANVREINTYEWAEIELAATTACLDALKQEAKRDLQI